MINTSLFIIPVATAIGVQALKLGVDHIKGNLDLKHMWDSYGGMPSSHGAFVACLTTMVGFNDGIASTAFAISMVFSILTIRDAIGFRHEIGTHGRILNRLVREHPSEESKTYPVLAERWGHTPLEITVGCAIGILVGLLAQIF